MSPLEVVTRGRKCAAGVGGMVATTFPSASEAAVEILRAGGKIEILDISKDDRLVMRYHVAMCCWRCAKCTL